MSWFSYIYTDSAELSCENVFDVLYLAKKYRLTGLSVVRILCGCFRSLQRHRTAAAASSVRRRTRREIETNAEMVLKSTAFLRLSNAIICDILERHRDEGEVVVYDRLLAWGRAECQRREIADDSENMRKVIGDAMKLVRFPLMSQKEFSEGPAKSSFLTDEENIKVFLHFNLGETPLQFSTVERRTLPHAWKRFQKEAAGPWCVTSSRYTWCLDFSVDADIRIVGFGLYGSTSAGKTYKVAIELKDKQQQTGIASKASSYTTVDGLSVYRVMFDEDVKLTSGTIYRATAKIDGPDSYPYGQDTMLQTTCGIRGRTVTFTVIPSGSTTYSDYDVAKQGQIPELCFK